MKLNEKGGKIIKIKIGAVRRKLFNSLKRALEHMTNKNKAKNSLLLLL